jgi:hypothetical protein
VRKIIEFPVYGLFSGTEYIVTAIVHLGKTSARGDDPDEVVSLQQADMAGKIVQIKDWPKLAERAIEIARETA